MSFHHDIGSLFVVKRDNEAITDLFLFRALFQKIKKEINYPSPTIGGVRVKEEKLLFHLIMIITRDSGISFCYRKEKKRRRRRERENFFFYSFLIFAVFLFLNENLSRKAIWPIGFRRTSDALFWSLVFHLSETHLISEAL